MRSHFLRALQKTTVTPTYTYNAFAASTTDASSYTFSSVSIGTASSTRLVVVTVQGRATPLIARTISSATIGGVSATIVFNSGGGNPSSIISAVVTTGTTADIVINWSGTMTNCIVGSYSLYDLTSTTVTAVRSDNSWSSSKTEVTIPVQTEGIVVSGVASIVSGAATWVGVDEDYESLQESRTYSSASRQMTSTNASYTVSATVTGNTSGFLAVAHWR